MKVLITGANGQLGSEIYDLCREHSNKQFLFLDRIKMPLDDLIGIENHLEEKQPDIIINAGAYTAVDRAESDKNLADKVNHLAPGVIAKWAARNGKRLVHISTDYVFSGDSDAALTESEVTSPVNVYGRTKLDGENAILSTGADAIIIRTSWLYSVYGKNFVKTMLRLLNEGKKVAVVSDQIGSPTYARDLAAIILELIDSPQWYRGVYHFSNLGQASWYEFAIAIQQIERLECQVIPTTSNAFPTPAKRPRFSLLSKKKIMQTFDVEIHEWRESLERMLGRLRGLELS